jgi:hypothetical protein
MQPSERKDFAGMLADAMGYYGKDVSTFTLNVWWTACQNFSLEQVSKALQRHAMDPERGQFAPKVADIVRVLAGTYTDRAQLAWGKVLGAMQSVGAYTDVVFDDPAIHACIEDLGGWVKICRSSMDELSYLQHRFCESHKAYVGRGQFDYPRLLGGDRSSDGDYAKRGLKPPKPAIVGDAQHARQVYLGGQIGGKTAISFKPLETLLSLPEALEAA